MTGGPTGALPLRAVLLSVVLVPALLLLGEGLYRARARADGRPHDPAAVLERLNAEARGVELAIAAFNEGRETTPTERVKPRRVPSPFYGWEYDSWVQALADRAAYFATPAADRTYDVLVLGGSVAAGFASQAGERLAERLRADPRFEDRPIKVFSGARGGAKQPQQLNFLVYVLGLGWRPDAVICLDGFNEVAIGNENADLLAHPLHPSASHWGHLVFFGLLGDAELEALWKLREAQAGPRRVAELTARYGLHRSAVLGDWALSRSRRAQRDYAAAHFAYRQAVGALGSARGLFGPEPRSALLEDRLALLVRSWATASRSMQAICDAFDIAYLHVLQPTLHDPGSKPLTDEEVRSGAAGPRWREGARQGYPMLRSAGERLRASGVNFVGGSMVFEQLEQTLYYDACHFSAEGQHVLAAYVAARFLETLPQD